MEAYRQGALARESERLERAASRRKAAWKVAEQAARMLREDFGASRVVVYGSLAATRGFHARSDIDLAVEGVDPAAFWRAWCAVDTITHDFEINLVALETASHALKQEILEKGVDL